MPICPKCARGGTGPHPVGCTPEMRFWRKVRFAANGCWEWTGATGGSSGYGQIRLGKRAIVYAHRFAYERTWGSLEPSVVVMHTCDNPLCVRVAHLLEGSQADNLRDMRAKGRHLVRAA